MIIRDANPTDISFIISSQLAMAKETEGLNLVKELVSKGVRSVFSKPHLGQYLIAEHDNSPISCLLTIPEWSDWRNSTAIWIHSLYVLPDYRNKKVFKAMYEYLQHKVLHSDDYCGIRLYVDKTNSGAIKAYTKVGMSDEHYSLFEWLK